MVSKVDRMQDSTIYGMAVDNYAELGYDPADADVLKQQQMRLSRDMTRMAKSRRKEARRVTSNDVAEFLHALGVWLIVRLARANRKLRGELLVLANERDFWQETSQRQTTREAIRDYLPTHPQDPEACQGCGCLCNSTTGRCKDIAGKLLCGDCYNRAAKEVAPTTGGLHPASNAKPSKPGACAWCGAKDAPKTYEIFAPSLYGPWECVACIDGDTRTIDQRKAGFPPRAKEGAPDA